MDSAQGPVSTELEQVREAPEFGAHTPLSEKLLAVAIRAQNFTGSTGIAIALTEDQDIICRASWGTSAPEIGTRLSLEHSFTGLCVRTGEPLRCDDAESDPRVDAEACRALGISAIAAAPVRRGVKVVGVIAAFSDTPDGFTDKHLLILSTLSEVIVELLDDPHSAQLPDVYEATPDLARATAVAQAPVTPVLDKALITAHVTESAAGYVHTEPAVTPAAHAATVSSPVAASAAAAKPAALITHPPDNASAKPSFTAPAEVATPKQDWQHAKQSEGAWSPFEVARGTEVLPAAVDPGRSPQQPKASTRLVFTAPTATQPDRELGMADTLSFAGIEGSSALRRRWLIPAAVLVGVVLLALAGWRWHVARRAGTAHASDAAVAQSSQTPALGGTKGPEATPAEPQHSPFSAPPMTTASAPAKAKPAPEPSADVTVRRSKQPVVEASGPVRRPGGRLTSSNPQDAQPPQLALSAPDLPMVLAKPGPAAVAAPVSRVLAAQLLHRVEPVYPEAARRLRLSGKVVVKATITKAGTVGNVRWISGNDLFHDASVAALKQWRYKPASLNNQPVESDLEIVLHFNGPTNR